MKQFVIVPLYGFKREPGFLSEVQVTPSMYLLRTTEMWASLTDIGFKDAIGQMEFEGVVVGRVKSLYRCPL